MHTQKKPAQNTYDTARSRQRLRRKRRARRLHIKCIFCVSVFTMSFIVISEWQILKPQSDSWKQYSAKTTALLTSDSDPDRQQPQSAVDPLPQEDPEEPLHSQPDGQLQPESSDRQLYSQSDGQLQPESFDRQLYNQSDILLYNESDGQLYSQSDLSSQWKPPADTTAEESETTHISSVSSDWNLILVNPWNEIPKDYEISLASLPNGQSIDYRCYPALTEMLDDCQKAGLHPLICSSYRTQEKQEFLFRERMDELTAQGYSTKDARIKAATSVARPGTSEHQIGLAVDIVDKNHQSLDSSQEHTMVQQWLMENSWKYGFILRYPKNKGSLTGIIYEPWHYRYVGEEAAREIYENGICLEEYLEELAQAGQNESE